MAIEFVCPACGETLRVSDGSAGRVVRCGGCMTMLRVPAAEVDPAAPASPFDTDDPAAPGPSAANNPPEPQRRARRARDRDVPEPAPDPDRTRRRRRPPPPPPRAGRGIFFWLVVTGAVMFLGTVGCCGGFFLLMPGPQWHKHESRAGGFKVDLPAPRHDIDRVGGVILRQEHAEGTILAGKLEEYAVSYRDLTPQQRGAGEEKLIDAEVQKLKANRAVEGIRREDPIAVSGCPGREVEFVSVNGGTYVVRIVVADTRVYKAFAGGQFAKPGNANVRRFLDSFEITDARLLAGARMRAAAAKLAAQKLRDDKEREERAKEEDRAAAEMAAEKAAREKAHRERVKEEDEAFLIEPYDGPPVPEARAAVGAGTDAHVYSFEREQLGGVVGRAGNWPLVRPGVLGAGVRGKAAYLMPESEPAAVGLGSKEGDLLKKTIRAPGGYTLAGWVRVRHAPVTVFSVVTAADPDAPVAEATLGRTHVSARLAGRDGPLELKRPWTRDDGWHHVALVRDNEAGGDNAKLYLDGTLVASGTAAAAPPADVRVLMGWVNRPPDPDWPGPPDADGKPAPPIDTQVVGAIDECVLVGRPLTDSEVRVLCGKEKPKPAEPALPVAPPPREKP
jgi:hypothetical protein